ncbi:RagB/SusD family nutrient uptake outer membrane protein [Flavitalea sp.]|nr:RagB/SusD family nutrient uptake outer membrane protein [Flavitalea sp.]
MEKYKFIYILFALLVFFSACKKTTILDQTPQDKYSDAVLWADVNLADAYLVNTYQGTGIGFYQEMLTGLTDESYNFQGSEVYATGSVSPDNTVILGGGFPNWDSLYSNIQRVNIFLSKIDEVPNNYPASEQQAMKTRTDIMKGEAHFIRAYCYSRLALDYGGLPLMKEPVALGDDFSSIRRSTFEETIDFISQDCDTASNLLPSIEGILLGRATKGAALALKSRVLLFAASDLTTVGVTNANVGYLNADRNTLWTKAKNAAKAVIDLGTYQLADFGAPDKAQVSKNYFNFFKAKDLSNPEVIWGKMYSKSVGRLNQMNLWQGSNGLNNWGSINPTQNLVDQYQMEDGSDFSDHFQINGNGVYINVSSDFHNPNPYYSRDPRFYGSILYDSAIWQKRFPNLSGVDPLGIYDRRTRVTLVNGTKTSEIFGIDTRQGPVETWNAGYTGYLMKKMLDDNVNGRAENNDNAWIEFRYAEVLLNYAEACIALNENGEANTYINKVRNRAGMPNFTGDLTSALRYEREVELVFEGERWYDIRRWKILEQVLTDAMGIEITETNTGGNAQTTWKRIVAQNRGPITNKMYWLPIMTVEVKKAPALQQNPGY